jgi:hypothetical protein
LAVYPLDASQVDSSAMSQSRGGSRSVMTQGRISMPSVVTWDGEEDEDEYSLVSGRSAFQTEHPSGGVAASVMTILSHDSFGGIAPTTSSHYPRQASDYDLPHLDLRLPRFAGDGI